VSDKDNRMGGGYCPKKHLRPSRPTNCRLNFEKGVE